MFNDADLIHIQHEYSFWGSALPGRSRFPALVRRLRRPWILTAHTVAPAAEVLGIPAAGGGWRAGAKRLVARIPGVRGVYAGRLRSAHQLEALTANLISVKVAGADGSTAGAIADRYRGNLTERGGRAQP